MGLPPTTLALAVAVAMCPVNRLHVPRLEDAAEQTGASALQDTLGLFVIKVSIVVILLDLFNYE